MEDDRARHNFANGNLREQALKLFDEVRDLKQAQQAQTFWVGVLVKGGIPILTLILGALGYLYGTTRMEMLSNIHEKIERVHNDQVEHEQRENERFSRIEKHLESNDDRLDRLITGGSGRQ